jgi:hypothetical protein
MTNFANEGGHRGFPAFAMIRLDVQKAIIEKAQRDNPTPFVQNGARFEWTGTTRVVSKATRRRYEPEVTISLETQPRLAEQVAACVCKEGVRFEDLVIATMVDPRLRGRIHISGLPRGDEDHDIVRFIKKVEETVQTPSR